MKKIIVLFGARGSGKSTKQKELIKKLEKEIDHKLERFFCVNYKTALAILKDRRQQDVPFVVEVENFSKIDEPFSHVLKMLLEKKAYLFFHHSDKGPIHQLLRGLELNVEDIDLHMCNFASYDVRPTNIAEFDQEKEYKTWEMRAECEDDVFRFFNLLDLKLHKFIIIHDTIFSDVRVVFQTEQPTLIASLYELFKPIDDSHVMYQTLAPAHAYTGERNYSLAF